MFDLDGTLVKSEIDFRKMKQKVVETFNERGVPSELVNMGETVGQNMEMARDHMVGEGREAELESTESHIESLLSDIELDSIEHNKPIDGVEGVLHLLRGNGFRVAVLTRGSRKYAESTLRKTGLDPLIDDMICRDDYAWWESKPNGIAMERLANRLGVEARECLFVGDHHMDLECALRSGALFVGVLSGTYDEGMWRDKGLEMLIDSAGELPDLLGELGMI
ncbi:MAG: HAD family hydrolase [Methanomassiliicoccales archaeon]